MRRERPRDIIFGILNEVYDPKNKDVEWYSAKARQSFNLEVNRDLTTSILSHLVFAMTQDASTDMGDYWQRTIFREVVNMIWTTHSGGTTAEHTARDIFKALNIPTGEDNE